MPGLSTRLLAGAGLLLLSATTMAQIVAPLPPPMPWRGASENLPVPAGHAWITLERFPTLLNRLGISKAADF
jgi:hypothetical protein